MTTAAGESVAHAPNDHLVHFYRTDQELDRSLDAFLADGMRDGCVGLLIASRDRRARFEASLNAMGGVDALTAAGRYYAADAQETLEAFLVDGVPDPGRFHATVGAVVARAVASGAPLRAFGEMVALLWDDGNVAGAIELEALWNDLATVHSFALYCAYPMDALEAADDLPGAQQVCASHTDVIGPAPRTEWSAHRERQSALFVPSPAAAKHSRRFAAEVLSQWNCDVLTADATLVVSELVTNAVMHARSVSRVSLALLPGTIRIEVHDTDRSRPQRRVPQPSDTSGRGMVIVDRLSARTGTRVHETGKVIWAEIERR